MSSKSQAAAKSAPAVKAVPKPAKERKERAPSMSLALKFALMEFVKTADPSAPDATVAENASIAIGRKVLPLTVGTYRKEFGLASVSRPKAGALAIELAAAKARIAELEATLREFSTADSASS